MKIGYLSIYAQSLPLPTHYQGRWKMVRESGAPTVRVIIALVCLSGGMARAATAQHPDANVPATDISYELCEPPTNNTECNGCGNWLHWLELRNPTISLQPPRLPLIRVEVRSIRRAPRHRLCRARIRPEHKKKSQPMSVVGLGCVKKRLSRGRSDLLSQLPSISSINRGDWFPQRRNQDGNFTRRFSV